MPTVVVDDGTSLFATDTGAGASVVLLAGWGFSHKVWREQVGALAPAHRVICVDLRGHGRSDAPFGGDYSIARHAHDVASALDALDAIDTVLVGWSLGGMVALRLAARRPDLVSRLVLVGTNGVAAGAHDEFPFGPPAHELLAAMVAGERERPDFRARSIAAGFVSEPDAMLLRRLVADSEQTPSHAGIACFEALFGTTQLDLLGAVRDIPLRQIVGSADRICPLDGARWLQQHFADARLDIVEGAGHYPMFEVPDRFGDALVGAVSRLPEPAATARGGPDA